MSFLLLKFDLESDFVKPSAPDGEQKKSIGSAIPGLARERAWAPGRRGLRRARGHIKAPSLDPGASSSPRPVGRRSPGWPDAHEERADDATGYETPFPVGRFY